MASRTSSGPHALRAPSWQRWPLRKGLEESQSPATPRAVRGAGPRPGVLGPRLRSTGLRAERSQEGLGWEHRSHGRFQSHSPRARVAGAGGWGRWLQSSRSAGGRGAGDTPEGGPADPLAVCMQKAGATTGGSLSRTPGPVHLLGAQPRGNASTPTCGERCRRGGSSPGHRRVRGGRGGTGNVDG